MMNREPSLAALLMRYIDSKEPERFSVSKDGYLHVSDLYDACFRQIYFSQKLGEPVNRFIPSQTRMLFEMGIAIEDRVRAWFERMEILAQIKPVLKNDELKVVGSPDGRMLNGNLVEIKGMNPGVFKLTKHSPLPKHDFQVKSYLWLDSNQKGKLFSVTWGSDKSPFRDQDIHYDLKVGEVIKKVVSTLREAQGGGKLPDRVCKVPNEAKAITCPFRDRCFAIEGELTQTIAYMLRQSCRD